MVRIADGAVKETVRIRLIVKAEIPGHDPLQCVVADVRVPMQTATRAADLSHENFARPLIAAKRVAKEKPPLPAGWPNAGRVIPATKGLKGAMNRAKWPSTHVMGDKGPMVAFPITWANRLGTHLNLSLSQLCKGKIADDE